MSNPIRIIVDSTCDLSLDEIKKLNLVLIPMTITIKDQNYFDIYEIQPKKLFDECFKYNTYPKTSSITIGTLNDYFQQEINNGYDVLYLSLSSKISSNYEHAVMLSQEYNNRVYVFDTLNLSSSIAILAKHALELVNQNKTIDEIIKHLEKVRNNIECMFVIRDLTFIRHGGRISKIE